LSTSNITVDLVEANFASPGDPALTERFARQARLGPAPAYVDWAPRTLEDALRRDDWEIKHGSKVYYVLRGDGLIKVGCTRQNVDVRLGQLAKIYPRLLLLTSEPGRLYVEAFRHNQFAKVRAVALDGVPGGTEWFHFDGALYDHVARITWPEDYA
jgi:hypothetical protein